jgi:hypothetical protein
LLSHSSSSVRTPGADGDVVRVQPSDNPGACPCDQRPVVALKHAHRCAHHLCQLKGRHACGKGVAGEGGAQVVEGAPESGGRRPRRPGSRRGGGSWRGRAARRQGRGRGAGYQAAEGGGRGQRALARSAGLAARCPPSSSRGRGGHGHEHRHPHAPTLPTRQDGGPWRRRAGRAARRRSRSSVAARTFAAPPSRSSSSAAYARSASRANR